MKITAIKFHFLQEFQFHFQIYQFHFPVPLLPLTVIPEGRTDDFTIPDSITGKRSGAGLFALGGRKRDGE